MRDDLARLWTLDPTVSFLNHGSFGACPRHLLALQTTLHERLEAEPVRFFVREYEGLLDASRNKLAAFVGADPADLVFVANATGGVSTVLRSLPLAVGDQLVVTDHEYPATRKALDFVAAAAGAQVVVAKVPFPIADSGTVLAAVLAALTPRTRLVVIDHVTSQTGLIFPVAQLAAALAPRGIELLVDGAHAPGMLPLDLASLGATYYSGNCHKWLCAPKAAGFLWVRRDRQPQVRPLAISHGVGSPRTNRPRFHLEHDWTGSRDASAALCVGAAIDWLGGLLPGGWDAVRARNHALVLAGRDVVAAALGIAAPAPDSMLGSMAALPLPDANQPAGPPFWIDPLQEALFQRGIEVPIVLWPAHPGRLIRLSAQLYNHASEYVELAKTLRELLSRPVRS